MGIGASLILTYTSQLPPALAWEAQAGELRAEARGISPSVPTGPEGIWEFAQQLLAQGEYYRAITEYQRFLFFFPQHPLSWEARLQIGKCYQRGERWKEAITTYRELLGLSPPTPVEQKLLYRIGECRYHRGEYLKARQVLEELTTRFPEDEEVTDQAHCLIGRSYLAEGKWQAAGAEFSHIRRMAAASELSQKAREGDNLPRKSPWVAGLSSAVLPGLGQLYVGRKQDAVVAFTLNAVFIWAAYEAFQHQDNAAGGILAFFELGWYTGNIYSAVSSTHKYNRKLETDFQKELEAKFSFSIGSPTDNLAEPFFNLSYYF